MTDSLTIIAIAGAAAIASPAGGLISLWRKPTTLFMSVALGFASGVLLATISFEMLSQALEMSSIAVAVAGFVAGFVAVYGFDLFIRRGRSRERQPSSARRLSASISNAGPAEPK
ncbi:MAG TPA: hypothetical protein VLE20_03085 [Blastocatellia bacterium]|nr:hypothetical protein [Blastocatellia bacterium]